MKKGVVIIVLCLLLLAVPIVYAEGVERTLKLKSEPYRIFVVRVQDPVTKGIASSEYGKANETGDSEIKFETTRAQVMFTIIVRHNDETEKVKETEAFSTGSEMFVELRDVIPEPENKTEIKNETISEVANQTESTENLTLTEQSDNSTTLGFKKTIVGLVTAEDGKTPSKGAIYTVIALIVLAILIFSIRKFQKRSKLGGNAFQPSTPASKKAEKVEKKERTDSYDRLEDAERKLEEARKEMEEIKKSEIAKEEAKLAKEQKRLARLKGEKIKANDKEDSKQN
ncbi:MAG: DUF4398 domain-containing protein [Nanoarchaeota archaeon]